MDIITKVGENLVCVNDQIREYRNKYGDDFCTEIDVYDGIASYTVMPDDVSGYTVEVDLASGESRHCGNGEGCFWTDWEQTF